MAQRPHEASTVPEPEVLLVEHHDCVQDMLRLALPRYGLPVLVAADGAEALDLYRRHRAAVVLLGERASRCKTLQALAALRQLDPQVRAVVLTPNLDGYAGADLLALGDARVLAKPFRLEELVVTVRALAEG